MCELWVEEGGINALRDWDWTFDENILEGVKMAKEEFTEFLEDYGSNVTSEEVQLPELPLEELDKDE